MGTEKTSLAIKIYENAFKSELIAKEVCAIHIKTYFLTGKHVNENFHCGQDGCRLDEERKLNVSTDSTLPMPCSLDPKCFCYACNRVFHLKCLNYNLESFMDGPRPFLCRECMRNPLNTHAVQYYESNSWKVGVNERRRSFFLSESLKAFPFLMGDQASDDEFDEDDIHAFDPLNEKINDSFNQSVSIDTFNAQKKQTEEAVLNHIEYARKAEAEIAELKRLLEQKRTEESRRPNTSRARSFTPSGFNAESTQQPLDDPPIVTAEHLFKKLYSSHVQHNAQFKQTRKVSFLTQPLNDIEDLNKSLPKLDDPNLSTSDRLLLASTKVNIENSLAQRIVSAHLQLDVVRKALPKITKFKGDAKGWIKFKQEVKMYSEVGQYEDEVLKMIVFGALEGLAEKRVKDLINVSTLNQIMEVLETSFGHSPTIISACEDDILKFKIKGELLRNDAVQINTLIQTYINACAVAGVRALNSNMLANHILHQLSSVHKLLFRQHYKHMRPKDVIQIPDLEVLFTFLEDLAQDLEVKAVDKDGDKPKPQQKPAQLQSTAATTSNTQSTSQTSNDYRFKIWDSKKAKFLGYDIQLVKTLTRKCLSCDSTNHFTIECDKFKSMSDADRRKLISNAKLCNNCLLTTDHKAGDCSLKLCCGFKSGTNRCSSKHHIILHEQGDAQVNSNYSTNQRRAFRRSHFNSRRGKELANQSNTNKMDSFSSSSHPETNTAKADSTPTSANTIALPKATPQVMSYQTFRRSFLNIFTSSTRTVKMFRHNVFGPDEGTCIYSIGDSAAEISLMREDLRQKLKIEGEPTFIELQWKDDHIQKVPAIKVNLELQALHNDEIILLKDVYAVDHKNFSLPARSLNVDQLKRQFPYLEEAEFESYQNARPSLLIGSPHASCIESIGCMLEEGEGKPVAVKTKLGWTIYGGTPELYLDETFMVDTTSAKESSGSEEEKEKDDKLDKIFEHFCSIESLGIAPKTTYLTEDEKLAVSTLENGWKVLESGSIEVPLVWKTISDKLPKLPDNFAMVYKRQVAHERKLLKEPHLHAAFVENFKELLKEGYARMSNEKDIHGDWPNVWYLPMSLVVNERKIPVKYRTVFDASAIYQNESLNKNLLKGPKLIVDMLKPSFKFRENRYAFICDVRHMYHRVFICERDQQVQRVLFRESPDQPMKVYIVMVMLFGPTSSPFTSQFVKNKVAEQWQTKYPDSAKALIDYTYMDDGLMSAETVEKAKHIALGCIEILKSINWQLIGFQSNSKEFLKSLPEDHVKKDLKPILSSAYDLQSYTTKVLGAVWDPVEDCFKYMYDNDFVKASLSNGHIPTKRDQASTIARMFDVRGEVTHFIIRGRILLQRSWKQGLGWDDTISEDDFKLWIKWLQDLKAISLLKIPRRYSTSINSLLQAERIELHVFADAGKEAFAAAAYFVIEVQKCRQSALVMAKAKVTPLKRNTRTEISQLPRLEMAACLIAARMAHTIKELHAHLSFKIYMWSDSSIALSWIKNPNSKLEKFAIPMVEEILDKTERNEWNYVSSDQNPADKATKFQKFDFSDPNSIWFKGPAFLLLPEQSWPKKDVEETTNNQKLTIATCQALIKPTQIVINNFVLPPIDCQFSSNLIHRLPNSIKSNWMKLIRLIARALKLIELVKKCAAKEFRPNRKDAMELEPMDYEKAELFVARQMQYDVYSTEYKALAKGYPISNKDFLALRIFMDSNGILRINSRVNLDPDIYPQQFLPFLPRKHFLTEVLLFYFHSKYNHISNDTQVAEVRSKFWIPHLRRAVAHIKNICNYCGYFRANAIIPPMAPLPKYRVNPQQKPFEVVGLDCTGEITVYKHYKKSKVYILLFTCTLTRFVHVHLLDNMDALSVLEAITLFWAAHGPVQRFVTDNGTNFVGASKRLKRDQEQMDINSMLLNKRNLLKQQLAEKYKLKWDFIPPYSPWFGGFYERLIKEIKRAIEITLRKKKLSRTELNIAIHEAAHRINNRPLTDTPIEAEDKPVLTPHMLAKYREGWPLLPSSERYEYDKSDVKDRLIYHRGRAIADEIMCRFVKERLPLITRQVKWFADAGNVKVGDLVLLIDPNKTRYQWPRARVVEVYPGRDGKVRVIDVQLPDRTIITRYSAQRAAKLDICEREEPSVPTDSSPIKSPQHGEAN